MLREYRSLLPYLKRHRREYIGGLLFLVVTDAAQLYLPQLVRRAIDEVANGSFSLRSVLATAAAMVGAAFLVASGRYFWRRFINGASRRIEAEIRERLFAHLQSLSSTFYGKNKTGDLMAHMTNDVNAIRMATGIGFALAVDGLIMSVSIIVIMLNLHNRTALLSVAPLPILSVGVLFFGRIVGEQFKKVQEGFSELSDMVQESFSGVRVLKTFVQEAAFGRRFGEKNKEYSRRNLVLVRSWGFFFPAVTFLAGITGVIFLLIGGHAVMEGTMSVGEFTAFFAYLQMLIWPLLGAGFTINMIQRAGASLQRLNVIFDQKPDITSPPAPQATKAPIRGAVAVRNLTFSYPGAARPALVDVSFQVPVGGILGILGKTGAGKSTLVQLLPRILDPPPGMVYVDGDDVREYDLGVLRSGISVVPQDNFLFSAPIKDNIAFGAAGSPEESLSRVASISTIERDLRAFPDGWNTVVGERGVTLSGGQKQRVSISRALAADAAIYILDDSLSSVDTETEDGILSELLPFLAGKTLIIVAHRISTLKIADRILVLEDGRVVQQGSHDELATQPGFYADIYRLQQLEDSLRKAR